MTPAADRLVERALAAQRESRRVAFRNSLEARDVVAMANSGGGVILFPAGTNVDTGVIRDHLGDFEIRNADDRVALIIGEAPTPVVIDGVVWVRHGARTAPANTNDLDGMLRRRIRRTFTTVLRPHAVETLPREVRDSESPNAVPIRVVNDPRAPAFRVVDYDRTHPYRQKEVLAAVRERLPEHPINQFDLQAVRHVHHTDANPDFSHKPVFGTRQYSAKFIEWLIDQGKRDPGFFTRAREEYLKTRK